MKKIFLMCALIMSVFAVNGAELFYNNGTSIFIEKSEEFVAVKTPASKAVPDKDAVYSLNTGSNVYSFVSSTGKKGGDELPVYFLGDMPAVAERTVFWRGEKPVEEMEKKYGMKLAEIFQTYPLYAFSVEGDSVEISERIVKNGDGYAFPNFVREAPAPTGFVPGSEPEDPYFDVQWHLHNTGNGKCNFQVGNGISCGVSYYKNADVKFIQMLEFLNSNGIEVSDNIKIAIMDSGVARHEDLKITETGYDAIWDREEVGGGTPNMDLLSNGGDLSVIAHGTHCAGVSAGTGNQTGMSGVCPWCWIYPVRYKLTGTFAEGEGIAGDTIIKIYEKYINNDVSVVNCSFGPSVSDGTSYVYPSAAAGIQNFMQNGRGGKGGIVVRASANDDTDSSYNRLLEYDFTFERNGIQVTERVVVVNASTAWDTKAEYSNYGPASTVAAPSGSYRPAANIATATIPGHGNFYKNSNYTAGFSGTSAAAPVVSGLFGVLFSVNPDLTLEEAMKILKQSSDKINPETGFWENGFSVKYGYGRVNLEKAVRLAAGFPKCAEIKDEECGNHIDDDCDDYVDEGCAEELYTGKSCNECPDQTGYECMTDVPAENAYSDWVFKSFKDGLCFSRSIQANGAGKVSRPCPDGTRIFDFNADGTRIYDLINSQYYCVLECNSSHPCERAGYYCSDEVLGVCLPRCPDYATCGDAYFCNENGHCVPKCGNGVIEDGEECDNGTENGRTNCAYGETGCELCTTQCQKVAGATSYCGDGYIDFRNGEECDYSSLNGSPYCWYGMKNCKVCTATCKKGQEDGIPLYCGDGVLSMSVEACDDGNNEDGDYCSANCKTVTGSCGDGTVQSNEECDNASDNGRTNCAYGETSCELCTNQCQKTAGATSYCGDGIIDGTNGENCDDPSTNGQTDCAYGEESCTVCTSDCVTAAGTTSFCGDGNVDSANGEACDNGSDNGRTGCTYGETGCNVCTSECLIETGTTSYCGDGYTDAENGEICDEGWRNGELEHCNDSCSGIVEIPEIPDEETPDSDEPADNDETADENEIPDNGGETSDSEEKPDSEEVSDSSESPDKGETAADSEISSDEYGSVSDDDTADEVIEEDFDAENDGDGNTAAENKKKSGGCSLLVL